MKKEKLKIVYYFLSIFILLAICRRQRIPFTEDPASLIKTMLMKIYYYALPLLTYRVALLRYDDGSLRHVDK